MVIEINNGNWEQMSQPSVDVCRYFFSHFIIENDQKLTFFDRITVKKKVISRL